MKISMHALSVEVFANTLGNLSRVLEKGLAHATQRKFDPGVLLAARLAPDMLPLTRQVQIACDLAKNSVAGDLHRSRRASRTTRPRSSSCAPASRASSTT